ncbi:hypothetical protein SPFM1_00277 [Salmonella phage SPFM1]|nr:hypothetical protein SPFM1_00277 [Salmonella phage SPFM1]
MKFTNENGNKPPVSLIVGREVCRTIIEALQDCLRKSEKSMLKFSYSFGKGEGLYFSAPITENRTRKLNIEPNDFNGDVETMINQEIFKDKWLYPQTEPDQLR